MENASKIIKWAEEILLSQGCIIKSAPEDVQITPWSNVKRILTSDGYIYLKQMPPKLYLEPIITQILYDSFHANVPQVIATNKDLNCFLTKGSGIPLREIFKNNFQSNLLCQGIKKYTYIQRSAVEHVTTFLELGVPDWRLEKLPILYTQLISNEDILIDDGMTSDEISLLYKLHPKFSAICELLSKYKIPETLDHGNFNDNNILIEDNTNHMTIIDWAETVITHPFFSLVYCLRNAAARYGFKETDKTYLELQDACVQDWLGFEERTKLLEAFSLAKRLWPIYDSLGEYRLMMSSNAVEFKSLNRHGRLSLGFHEWIKIEK